jgi:hypothetical protein
LLKVASERTYENSYIIPCPGRDSKPAPVKVRFPTNSWAGPRRQMRNYISAVVFSAPLRWLLPVSRTLKLATQQCLPVLTINNSEQKACNLAQAE